MRSSVFALLFVSQVFLTTAFGQEQKPLLISSDTKGTISGKSAVNITRGTSKKQSGPAYQRMSVSQRLIQQRAFLQAKQRVNRINARKAMGITPGRPTVAFNPSAIPTNAQIMQEMSYFTLSPFISSGFWYGPIYDSVP
ncbi:hypothetical protein [uncultured Gimesia sp.]|uniref:hypothetical protein n=1 Tax=uncultured Gimesia sp. TaxID=1678688 RepID=UPI0030DC92C2|tara:strand:- start:68561 stop:68977 length:417 start_codon:yes stop_codon:yes gene_type:complete